MKIISDLHIHSKYSRAVSRDMDFEHIDNWAQKKGIDVMGTGDFTHPKWFDEIKTKLKTAEDGLFKLKKQDTRNNNQTRFMLTAEIACIYSKGGKTRRLHHIVFAPSFKAVSRINNKLNWIGNLKSDGRPILGLDSKKLLEIVLEADERCVLIPAHAWTPWFSIFGSMSGFDSIEECFDDMSSHIFAIETGLSSDPPMNWRLSALNDISLISNSDSHSPSRIGREANVFDCDLSYDGIIDAIKLKDSRKFLYTIEFFPEEGKYHFDGHRSCEICFSPNETKKHKSICPKCGKKLTVGVLYRVDELSDRDEKIALNEVKRVPYKNLVPLDEIIGEARGVGPKTKTVAKDYNELIEKVGPELSVLIDAPIEKISETVGLKIAEGVRRVREGKVIIKPGYDGEYGKIKLFEDDEDDSFFEKQKCLF